MTQQLLRTRDLAEMLNVDVSTIYRWRRNGFGPRSIKVGGLVRYDKADVQRYIDERGSTAVRSARAMTGGGS